MKALTRFDKALKLATAVHEDQVDKNGEPYIHHPIRVAKKYENLDDKVVALLHDVVEDFGNKLLIQDLLWHLFDPLTCRSVEAISHRQGETLEDYYQRVSWDGCARRVKIQDIFDNLDPDRLDKLDDKTKKRLKKKYLKALDYLL